MAELHERLKEIARLQGREYIDGTRLDGFSPEDPPPPVTDSVLAAIPDEDPDFEPDPEPSPLIPPAFRPQPQPAPAPLPAADLPRFEFSVLAAVGGGCVAECEGHGVELADSEREAVRRIVARALVRKFSAMLPRRRRRASIPNGQPVASDTAPARKPVRRVRRKSLLADGAP